MSEDERIEDALARIADRRAAGESVSIEEMLSENPEIAGPLRAHLRMVRQIDGLGCPPDGGSGALATLSSAGASLRPLSLPELPDDDPSPVVLSKEPTGRWGRYAVQGQIARGGVGVVLKAHDPDLGRDVALKTLRQEHAKSHDVLQRFVEEAQIGGQLQHPGIVPVHEFGTSSDGHPYFAMRLVKGKTLASLLAARESPSADGPRFLSVFHAVCQTVAYAHQRGIMHRDLKPSNVMVGSFGEVQVLDWGMAKVLASGGAADDARASNDAHDEDPPTVVRTVRSASGSAPSIEGSIIGTPQYMAPEQARGQTSAIDERADVFSLGAILCEILTGKGPYSGRRVEDLLQAAIRGDLRAAHERIRRCDADLALVALAVRCLAPAREDRPKDASVVAREVTNHLASLDRRARKAEVDAAEARVRAEQERRARKLTLALSASVIAFVVLGAGGWFWRTTERQAREESTAREVAEALDDATTLRAKAEATEVEQAPPLWQRALESAKRARGIAEAGEADAATKARAAATASAIGQAWKTAETAAERRRSDAAAVERLDRIRACAAETWSWKHTSDEYATAFREILGVDLETMDVAEASRRVQESSIRDCLVHSLDFWMQVRVRHDPRVLGEVLARVDADPWRTSLRQAMGDAAALREIADRVKVNSLDVHDAINLARAIGDAGDPTRAATLSADTWRCHPGDFWACTEAARWNSTMSPARVAESVRYSSAAVAIQPRSAMAHCNLGAYLCNQREYGSADAEFREAIRLDRNLAIAHYNLGILLGTARGDSPVDRDGQIAEYLEAVRLQPSEPKFHCHLGLALRLRGDVEGAVLEFREAIRLDPKDAEVHCDLGTLLREHGDLVGAIAEYRQAIRLRPDCSGVHSNLGIALDSMGDAEGALSEHREALRLDSKSAIAHVSLGTFFSNHGDIEGAIRECREAIQLDPTEAKCHADLGNALLLKGDVDGAIKECREAIRLDPQLPQPHGNLGGALFRRGEIDGAITEYREAVRLDPSSAVAHEGLGRSLLRKGALNDALPEFQDAVRLAPASSSCYGTLGATLAQTGDRDGAITALREAIRLDAKNAEARGNLGVVLIGKADVQGAITEFREAARLAPDSACWHEYLARCLAQTGAIVDAIPEWREVVRLEAKNALAHVRLGDCLRGRGDADAAITECREGVRLEPAKAWFRLSLGVALQDAGDVDGALVEFREAVRLEPNSANAHEVLAGGIERTGDCAGAIVEMRKAIQLDPIRASAHGSLAHMLAASEHIDDAVAAYREALRLEPHSAPFHFALSLLLDRSGDREGATAEAREAARLDPRYALVERVLDFIRGQAAPSTAREGLDFALLAGEGMSFGASSRAWAHAFSMDPAVADDWQSGYRFSAGNAAANAAAGVGIDASSLDVAERGHFRRQAVEWLRAHLDAVRKAGDARGLRRIAALYKTSADFAELRGGPDLEKAPAADREACRRLWADVDALLAASAPPR